MREKEKLINDFACAVLLSDNSDIDPEYADKTDLYKFKDMADTFSVEIADINIESLSPDEYSKTMEIWFEDAFNHYINLRNKLLNSMQ